MKKKAQNTESCNDDNENVHAYQTPQALGKAVGKVKSQLPKSPRKRKAVITKLATTSGFVITKHKKGNSGGNKKLSAATSAPVFFMALSLLQGIALLRLLSSKKLKLFLNSLLGKP